MKIRTILEHCKKQDIRNKTFFDKYRFGIESFNGIYEVKSIDSDCWVHTDKDNSFCCHYDTELINLN